MEKGIQIDILVTTYKRADDIAVLLRNLENQVFKNFKLQIFDGSPDNSVKKVVDLYICSYRSLKYPVIFHNTCSGMTRQRNIAVDSTTGDISIFLDDDVELDPNYLLQVINVFNDNGNYNIAALNGFDMYGLNNSNRRILGKRKKIYKKIGLLPDIGPAKYLPWGHSTPHFVELKEGIIDVDLLIGHNMAFRTSILKMFRFDTFFEQYDTYVLYDDQDICLRLRNAGYKCVLCYDAKLIHKESPSGRPAPGHYGYQAFYNAYRNWKLYGGKKFSDCIKFWIWEFLDIILQLPKKSTRNMAWGRFKIFLKSLFLLKRSPF